MITPEHQIKVAIENGLTLPGISRVPQGMLMDNQVTEIYEAVFHKRNENAIRELLIELQQQPEDWWNDNESQMEGKIEIRDEEKVY